MDLAAAHTIIFPFYEALTKPSSKNVAALIASCAAPDWRSFAGPTQSKGRDEFIAQVQGFGMLIPDLNWTIIEVLIDGNRIVVRSEASGTPTSDFFGVPHAGRSFRIMTIDIHTVVDGRLAVAHHVEDWAGAIRQLKG